MSATRTLLLTTLLPWGGHQLFAQCAANDTTICTATIDAMTIKVSDTRSLTGSYECYHLLAGADLDFDGVNSLFMVESGATVFVSGAGNLVLAKTGSSVSFCGSGYGNHVKHEAGITLDAICMTRNSSSTCARLTFLETLSIAEEDGRTAVRYDAIDHSLVLDAERPVGISVVDMMGRTVEQGQGNNGRYALGGLRSGTYVAIVHNVGGHHPVRFVVP